MSPRRLERCLRRLEEALPDGSQVVSREVLDWWTCAVNVGRFVDAVEARAGGDSTLLDALEQQGPDGVFNVSFADIANRFDNQQLNRLEIAQRRIRATEHNDTN